MLSIRFLFSKILPLLRSEPKQTLAGGELRDLAGSHLDETLVEWATIIHAAKLMAWLVIIIVNTVTPSRDLICIGVTL